MEQMNMIFTFRIWLLLSIEWSNLDECLKKAHKIWSYLGKRLTELSVIYKWDFMVCVLVDSSDVSLL